MNKLELLLEKCPEQVEELVNKLYKKNFKKKSKKIFHFKALGKTYDSDIFTDNYINFIQDISKIHNYEFFKLCIPSCYLSTKHDLFTESHIERNQVVKICKDFYISTYSSTEKKIEHVKNICEMIGIKVVEL